jgi:enoyl-CoA hydratase
VAKEILLAGKVLTGRVLDAAEALAAGLVSSVHEPSELLGAAHALADRIAEKDPRATQLTKRVLAAPRDAHPAADLEAQAELFESPETHRRMTEFLEKRSLEKRSRERREK